MRIFRISLIFVLVFLIRQSTAKLKCAGGFDIYFILDKSGSVPIKSFQEQTVQFATSIIQALVSTKARISLITFSNSAKLDLPLTNDRRKINKGLNRLMKVVPGGDTRMEYGIDLALKQIKETGGNSASIVILLTDGALTERNSYKKTDILRRDYSATVFAIGVNRFREEELKRLANKPSSDYVYTVTNYDSLSQVTDKIVDTACIEVTRVEPNKVCVGTEYDVTLYGKGFTKTSPEQSIINCNFRYNNTIEILSKPIEISDTKLKCRAPEVHTVNSFVVLQVSINEKVISSDIRVVGISCTITDPTVTILVILLVLLFILLIALWWFYATLPCVKQKKKEPKLIPAAVPEPEPESRFKWPTVDASFYGGGGVGGIKPMKVKWGEKGATDEGNKLTKTPDANIIDPGGEDEVLSSKSNRSITKSSSPSCFARTGIFFVYLGSLMLIPYKKCASYRPQKGGQSNLYSNASERAANT